MASTENVNTGWLCRFLIILVCVHQGAVHGSIDDILALEDDYTEIIEPEVGTIGKSGSSYLKTFIRGGKTYVRHELDMLLPRETFRSLYTPSELGNRKKRNAVNDKRQLWRFSRIPYIIDAGFNSSERLVILEAIAQWSMSTCVRFVQAQPTEYNVLTFKHVDKGICSSHVGMIQGEQFLELPPRCRKRHILLHEIGHALGLYHEHTRAVRDSFVTILWQNIAKGGGREQQFDKMNLREYSDFSKPYDYESIMHYGKYYFSRDRSAELETIVALKTEYTDMMGNADHVSFLDAKIVSQMYQCSANCKPKHCPDEGFLGRDCECWCPGTSLEPVVRCRREAKCKGFPHDPSTYLILSPFTMTEVDTDKAFPSGTLLQVGFQDNCICGHSLSEFVCEHGVWNGTLPKCISPPCYLDEWFGWYDIESSVSGENITVVENGDKARLTCKDWPGISFELLCEYCNLTGKVISCTDGACKLSELDHENYSYHDPDTGDILARDDAVPAFTQVIAFCLHQFDEINVTCSALGEWMDKPDSCHARKPCTIIPNANMSGSYYSGYDVTCLSRYTMNPRDLISNFKCEWDGTWSPFTPECVESDCIVDPEMTDSLNTFVNMEGQTLGMNSLVKHGEKVRLGCPRRARQEVTCNKGFWETEHGSTPTCLRPPRG